MSARNKTLVIVESPAKCQKIESYLGSNYKCMASFGHIRQLDAVKEFEPIYSIAETKKKQETTFRGGEG